MKLKTERQIIKDCFNHLKGRTENFTKNLSESQKETYLKIDPETITIEEFNKINKVGMAPEMRCRECSTRITEGVLIGKDLCINFFYRDNIVFLCKDCIDKAKSLLGGKNNNAE